MPSHIQIKFAQPQDHQALTDIAFSAKRHWGYPEDWIELWRKDLTITPAYVKQNQVIVARDNEQVAGFCSLERKSVEPEVEIGHFWVMPAYMGQGIGRRLMERAIQLALVQGASSLLVVADPYARGFYEKMGAVKVGESPSMPEGRMLPVLEILLD